MNDANPAETLEPESRARPERGRWARVLLEKAGQALRPRWVGHVQPSLTIPLEASNRSTYSDLYVRGRTRLATATGVRFLDANHLLATHLVGMRLFLIRFDFDAGTHSFLRDVSTDFEGEPVITDLIDFDGRGRIALSNFDRNAISFYRMKETRISHERDLPIPTAESDGCHGVRFLPPGDIVCATSTRGEMGVYFLSSASGEILYSFGEPPWRPKDVSFIDSDRMIVVSSRGAPTKKRAAVFESRVRLIRFDVASRSHTLLDEVMLPACQVDACVEHAGAVYITDQMGDCVHVCIVEGARIRYDRRLPGYRFPHGIDMLPESNLMAVTNYGTSNIVLTRLNPE